MVILNRKHWLKVTENVWVVYGCLSTAKDDRRWLGMLKYSLGWVAKTRFTRDILYGCRRLGITNSPGATTLYRLPTPSGYCARPDISYLCCEHIIIATCCKTFPIRHPKLLFQCLVFIFKLVDLEHRQKIKKSTAVKFSVDAKSLWKRYIQTTSSSPVTEASGFHEIG